jgi:hypothetical protein
MRFTPRRNHDCLIDLICLMACPPLSSSLHDIIVCRCPFFSLVIPLLVVILVVIIISPSSSSLAPTILYARCILFLLYRIPELPESIIEAIYHILGNRAVLCRYKINKQHGNKYPTQSAPVALSSCTATDRLNTAIASRGSSLITASQSFTTSRCLGGTIFE